MKQPPYPYAEGLEKITCIGAIDAKIILCRSLVRMVFVVQILGQQFLFFRCIVAVLCQALTHQLIGIIGFYSPAAKGDLICPVKMNLLIPAVLDNSLRKNRKTAQNQDGSCRRPVQMLHKPLFLCKNHIQEKKNNHQKQEPIFI